MTAKRLLMREVKKSARLTGYKVEMAILDEVSKVYRRDDGLRPFAVWTYIDHAEDRVAVRKVEPYNPSKVYPDEMTGVVRAKDELDAWRVVTGSKS